MSKLVAGYQLGYILSEKSLYFWRLIQADVLGFPARARRGVPSWPFLVVSALPDRIDVHLRHVHFGDRNEDTEFVASTRSTTPQELAHLLGHAEVDRLAALYRHPDGWAMTDRERWLRAAFDLFTPIDARTGGPVARAAADFYELGDSFTGDGRPPRLTLRIGRARDEIVLEHGYRRPDGGLQVEVLERFEPPGSAEAAAALEEYFGTHLASVAAWFHSSGVCLAHERWMYRRASQGRFN